MHIITTSIGTTTFPREQLTAVFAYIKFLRAQDIEYTHVFED